MHSVNPLGWWDAFLGLRNSSPRKTIGITLLVAMACSFAVSLTAVTLRPLHDANRLRESAASLVEVMEAFNFDLPRERLVELATGDYVSHNPGTLIELDSERDPAGLNAVESVAEVYELRRDDRLELVVLPVRGTGYQSLIKAYLVLRGDLETVAALTFYEQNETPGLGARITDRDWQALWTGKRVTDADGAIRLRAVRGDSEGVHEVDGISGATRTMNGINKMLRFWLGPDGYGPYIARLKEEAGR